MPCRAGPESRKKSPIWGIRSVPWPVIVEIETSESSVSFEGMW
jgi:hypothetical protein